ncbi:MAG: hypothetical protein JWO37_2283 [Acidimicrobiales bacterium]|nr:hypothetical protein [Acidimicrobiales bacterium]
MARRPKPTPGTLVLGGVFAVVLGICVVAAVLQLAQSPKVKTNLGPATFVIGNAKGYAKLADADGPFGFRDPRGGDRDLWLVHRPGDQWFAVVAHLPNEPKCRIDLDRATKQLKDCHGRTYRGDEHGLEHAVVSVDAKGRLVVEPGQTAPDTDQLP